MSKKVIKTVIMGIIMIMILSFGNTVLGVEIEKINLDKESLTMNVGETALVLYTVEPSGANNVGNRTWLSHNPEVVEVDENGKITAKKEGTAQIELVINATKETGETYSATAKCEVAVSTPQITRTVTEDITQEVEPISEQVTTISEMPAATTYNVTETMIEKKEMSPQTKLIALVIIIGLIVIFILIGTASDKKEGKIEKRRVEKEENKTTPKQNKETKKDEKKETKATKEVKEKVVKEEPKKEIEEKKVTKKETGKTEKKTTNTKTSVATKSATTKQVAKPAAKPVAKTTKTTTKTAAKPATKSTTKKTSSPKGETVKKEVKKDSEKGEKVKNGKKGN